MSKIFHRNIYTLKANIVMEHIFTHEGVYFLNKMYMVKILNTTSSRNTHKYTSIFQSKVKKESDDFFEQYLKKQN